MWTACWLDLTEDRRSPLETGQPPVVGVSLLVCLVTGLAVRARHGVTVSVSSVLCPTRRPVKESTKQILFYLQIIIVHIVAVKRDVQLRGERGEEEESLL